MIKRILIIVFVVFGLSAHARAENPCAMPDVHVGDTWRYRAVDGYTNETTLEYSHRIVKIDNNEITIQITNKNVSERKLQFLTREWNPVDIDGTKFDPYYPEYKFPLRVGDAWTKEFKSSDTHGTSYSSFVKAKVVALEKVTVPAGTFDAYRIERDIEVRTAGADANLTIGKIITWYAPSVKKYVRRESTQFRDGRERSKKVNELLDYSLRENSAAPGH